MAGKVLSQEPEVAPEAGGSVGGQANARLEAVLVEHLALLHEAGLDEAVEVGGEVAGGKAQRQAQGGEALNGVLELHAFATCDFPSSPDPPACAAPECEPDEHDHDGDRVCDRRDPDDDNDGYPDSCDPTQ